MSRSRAGSRVEDAWKTGRSRRRLLARWQLPPPDGRADPAGPGTALLGATHGDIVTAGLGLLETTPQRTNPRALTADEAAILTERLVARIATLEDRIVEQRAVLADAAAGSQRTQAKRVLRTLLRWADAHTAALTCLREGGPRCRQCGDPVSFERLDAQPLTTVCASCPGVLAGSEQVVPHEDEMTERKRSPAHRGRAFVSRLLARRTRTLLAPYEAAATSLGVPTSYGRRRRRRAARRPS